MNDITQRDPGDECENVDQSFYLNLLAEHPIGCKCYTCTPNYSWIFKDMRTRIERQEYCNG